MSSLTEEQKRKIEESRRKALAIRAAKASQNLLQTKDALPAKPGTSATKPGTPTAVSNNLFKKRPDVPSWLGKKSSNSGHKIQSTLSWSSESKLTSLLSKDASNKTSSVQKPLSDSHHSKNKLSGTTTCSPSKSIGTSNAVKGKCMLISRERFVVDVGYIAPLIALFKNMQTKQYDMLTKKWSFELREYNDLMNSVKCLSASVTLEPLPRCVLTTFDKAIRGIPQPRSIPEADLSKVDPQLVNGLFAFQRECVNFAIKHNGRILMADDMGLGKTIQALCIAAYYREEWPLLIVVPSSVRFAWRQQILHWLPSVRADDVNVIVTGKESSVTGDIVIISYDLMVRRRQELIDRRFKVIIMDESHFLKNNKSARTQSAFPLLKKAKRVLLLSGTPALSRPSELFMQLSAVDNQLFPRFHEFGLRYCNGRQMPWGWDFSGSSNLTELQIVLEERIMIRRLKQDVLDQLPSKVRQMVILDPGSVKIGREMKNSHKFVHKAKGSDRHSALLGYFHETGAAKKQAVKEYVMDHLEAGNKILVFAHHKEVLETLEEAVAKKYRYIRIDGQTPAEQRNILSDQFQKNNEVRIAILSICAANAGLNLMAASLVIFAELFWNPGILVQAEDRAHRIGQQDSVNIHYLVASGTADDFIWPLVQAKLEVLGKAGLSKENFTEAYTTYVKDPKQKEILDYFDESFFEDDLSLPDDSIQNNSERKTGCGQSTRKPTDNGPGQMESLSDNLTSTSGSGHTESEATSDWLDDDCFQEIIDVADNADSPPAKKVKTG